LKQNLKPNLEREGFPNVVLQANAMGLPCIVSDINGCNEIITDGYNGVIIPPKDENALFQSMIRLVENPEKRLKLAKNSRDNII
jgi:glycosyltransferase involved in cell wall biosynthesis